MCTQELIWCSCGHGELLPIRACPRGRTMSHCYTIVHGSLGLVVPSECSYCKSGLQRRKPLPAATPPAPIAAQVHENAAARDRQQAVFHRMLRDPDYWPDDGAFPGADNAFAPVDHPSTHAHDLLDAGLAGFALDRDVWEFPGPTPSTPSVDGEKAAE